MMEVVRGHDELHIYIEHIVSQLEVIEELEGVETIGVRRSCANSVVEEQNASSLEVVSNELASEKNV